MTRPCQFIAEREDKGRPATAFGRANHDSRALTGGFRTFAVALALRLRLDGSGLGGSVTWPESNGGPLQRLENAQHQPVIGRNVSISSHDGWVHGLIVVQETSDSAAIAECESRLSLLLKDAIGELGR
jgi:hypothetical protein